MGDIRERFGETVKALRKERGWTLRDMEEKSGIGYAHLARIEIGKYNVRLDTIEKIEEAFDMKLKFERSDTGE